MNNILTDTQDFDHISFFIHTLLSKHDCVLVYLYFNTPFFQQDFSVAALGWMKWAMPTLVAIAILGGLSVHIMTSSRMCFAGARNGHMPELLAHINMKCMSPMPSLVFLVRSNITFL